MDKNISILLIEDENFVADLYFNELSKLGYAVKVANDAKSGLTIIEKEKIDFLLLDIMLPGANGLELLKELRARDLKIITILLTNLGQNAVIDEAFRLGAEGYFIKSNYTPKELAQEMRRIIEKYQSGKL